MKTPDFSNYSYKNKLFIADVLLIIVAAVWGSSYGVAKNALAFYPVLGFLTIRFGLTSLLLLPHLIHEFCNNKMNCKTAISSGIPLGGILWLIFIAETYGVFYTSASKAAFLISLCMVITPFVEWVILKNKPNKWLFICMALSIIGTFLLTLSNSVFYSNNVQSHHSSFLFNTGDACIVMAAFFRACMVTFTKKYTSAKTINTLSLTAVQSCVVFMGCLGLFVVFEQTSSSIPTHISFWLSTTYLVLFCTLFAFFIQNWAIKIGSPTRTSLLMGSEPIFGALFAVWFLSETVTLLQWFGGFLIVLSAVLLIFKQ